MTGRRRRGTGLARALVAALVFAALVAAMLELATRAAGLAPGLTTQNRDNAASPFVPYVKRPGSHLKGRSESDEFDFDYAHDARGFRDVEHAVPKPPGRFRIAALGDSFTYGVGAPFAETWPSRLETLLGPPVEVIRLGLPRYFPAAERLVFEHFGLPYEPDLVLVAVLPNDVIDTHWGLDAIRVDERGFLRSREGERLGPLGGWLFAHSHVARIVIRRAVEWMQQRESPVVFADVYRDGGVHEDDWLRLEADLTGLLDLTRSHGAQFALISIPQQGPWDERSRYPDRRLAAWSAAHGVTFIPVLDALQRAAGGEPLYYPRDGHCTPAGYAVVAEEVARGLRAARLVP